MSRAMHTFRYVNTDLTPEQLGDELRIVWLQPPETVGPYVREMVATALWRERRPALPRRAVAYAVLRPDARSEWPGHIFWRRFWWKREASDEATYGDTAFPMEGVDPLRICAGEYSYRPASAAAGGAS
jgi:hypothetical protein